MFVSFMPHAYPKGSSRSRPLRHRCTTDGVIGDFITRTSDSGGSPIPLLKTVSHKSNCPSHASQKIRKTASRSQKKVSNHVSRKNAKAKSFFT